MRRVRTSRAFTQAELDSLPLNHNANKNPNLTIERNVISVVDVPIFSKVANKIDFVFYGAEPLTEEIQLK